ncbi:branched-chain amino acid aminotransferase [Calothrix sp. NIES-4071]|nr:branched-chain amino acid aminotransferase [Calothrix sp. NIES-4071]BAZ64034.1 branched-chain amino acid aminotransferase [Calothrix sp. NIES-4105]
MYNFLPIAYFEDKFIPFSDAKISIATHALHYGTGALGGLRGIPDPQDSTRILLFRLDRHCQRLSTSARFLHYDISAEKIKETIIEFIRKNQPSTSFYIRPFVYTADLGIAPRLHNIKKDFFVYGLELGEYSSPTGVTCRISSWYRQADVSFPLRGKISAAYITSSLAKTEAVESGFDEAILMNSQGKVSEASGMNIFIVRNGQIFTPGFDQDILEGITRDSVMKLANDLGFKVIERPIDKSELFIADEVFLCGTAAKVLPVLQIENFKLPESKPITEKLREKFTAITENRDPKYQEWIYSVSRM